MSRTGTAGPGPVLRVTETVPRPPRRRDAAWAAAVNVGALVAALVTAAVPWTWPTVALLVVAATADATTLPSSSFLAWGLRRADAGPALRVALQMIAVVLLATRVSGVNVVGVSATAVAAVVLRVAQQALTEVANRWRHPPVLTRNVALAVQVPAWPGRPLAVAGACAHAAAPVAAVGVALHPRTGPLAAALVAAFVLALAPVVLLAAHLRRLRRSGGRRAVADAALGAWRELDPRVVLYFAGTPEEAYQLNMWLEPVERLDSTAAVLVRDPEVLAAVGATTLPVFCVEYNGAVAGLPLTEPVVVLFPTHTGNNLSLLRRGEVRAVFVGHGDSDKPDSMNRYARVYDEIWVAGPLGRTRYEEAAVGVPTERIVEVGRPQVPAQWPPVPEQPTVLYAPTWEGWGDDPHHSSLPHAGVALVESLLRLGVRVLYRPHPLTGVRNGDVRRAHQTVVATLRAAGAVGPEVVRDAAPTSPALPTDALDAAVSSGARPWSRAAAEERTTAWTRAFWAATPPETSRILTGAEPGLHACFAQAHLLVGDISSVVSDWLATDRPYAVVDTRDLGATAFCRRFPVAAGGMVLSPDLTDLEAFVDIARGAGDPTHRRRTQTRRLALGEADPRAGFARAVADILDSRH